MRDTKKNEATHRVPAWDPARSDCELGHAAELTENPYRRAIRGAFLAGSLASLMLAGNVPADELVWHSGFETGFPGSEWLDFDNGSYSANGDLPHGRVSAWTIVDRQSGEPGFAGNHAYKGWVSGTAGSSHRAYPVLHSGTPTPLVNTFFVYLDADYERMSVLDWIHLGTWGNHDPAIGSGRWALHTMAVRDRKLEFAHTAPFHGNYIGPAAPADFPLHRWVRLTVYMVYQETSGFVQAWQDGVPMLRATVPGLKENPGTRLRTAHWGTYASGGVARAVQYNDEIRICTLNAPLTDLVSEPQCPSAAEGQPANR